MLAKMKRAGGFLLYALLTNAIYGTILFMGFTWLTGFSQVIAHFWNLALIILGLVIDTSSKELIQTERLARQLRNEKEVEQAHGIINWIANHFVSFKTILYIFYALILVVSPVIDLYPTILSESLTSFIQSNSYSILFVIAFDMIVAQMSKDSEDRKKMRDSWEKLKGTLSEKDK